MYKKFIIVLIVLCGFIQNASDMRSWLEIKPSYFLFSTSPINEIYDGAFQIQGSASVPLCKYLDLYGSVGYRQASGNALNSGQVTNIRIIPVDIGLKPVFNFSEHCYYFLAIGPRYFSFYQDNKSLYVDGMINDAGVGFFANTGFDVELAKYLLLGVFAEYSYEKKTVYPNMPNVYSGGSTQLGGFAFGVSLGYVF